MAWVRVREKATGKISVKSEGVASMLRDKYEIITSNAEPEVASNEGQIEVSLTPNLNPANPAGVDDGVELANARAEYETLFGEKPHGRLKLESIKKLIAEKNGQA